MRSHDRIGLDLHPQPVIGRFDMRRQARFQRLEVEVAVQIGEDRALRLQPFDPGQRLADAEMAGMRTIAQRIDDPQIEAFERLDALCGRSTRSLE